MADVSDYSAALKYGPQTAQALQRSKYLADALRQMSEGSQHIQSGGELGARLLATALLQHADNKARKGVADAALADQNAETDRILAGFGDGFAPATVAPPAPPAPGAAADAGGISQSAPVPPGAGGLPSASAVMPQAAPVPSAPSGGGGIGGMVAALRNLIGPVKVTSGYRTPEHNAEVGGVPNSLHTRNGGEAIDFKKPPGLTKDALAESLARAGLPKTELLDEGDHIHWGWGSKGGQGVQSGPVGQLALMGGPNAPQPLQAPPAPAQSIPAPPPAPGGGPTPAVTPQAAAGVTYNAPTQAEMARALALLKNPRTHDQGVAFAMKLQERAVTPQKWDSQSVGGVPLQIDPYTGQTRALPIPEGARTRLLTAQDAGIPTAPQGLYVQRNPLGELKEAPGAPPPGYNAGPQGYAPIKGGPTDPTAMQPPPRGFAYQPNGSLSAIQGGPEDPTRPQVPQAGYSYVAPGQQAPIPGSGADPHNPNNIIQGTQSFRQELKPVVDQALAIKRNIDSVRAGFAQQNGPGDIAMVNGLQRLIDDGVVREGDVALQLKAQGLAGGMAGLSGYLSSKGFFEDPKIRRSLMASADAIYSSVNGNYRDRVMGYRSMADKAFGPGTFDSYVFPPDVAKSLGWTDQPNAPAAPRPAAPAGPAGGRAALLSEAVKRHLPMTAAQIKEARELGLIK